MLAGELAVAGAVQAATYGRKALVGQFTEPGTDRNGKPCTVDRSERINFERSKYIPGNGPEHRLGKRHDR